MNTYYLQDSQIIYRNLKKKLLNIYFIKGVCVITLERKQKNIIIFVIVGHSVKNYKQCEYKVVFKKNCGFITVSNSHWN